MFKVRQLSCVASQMLRVTGTSVTGGASASARSLAYVSNKRITRIPSDTHVEKSELSNEGNETYIDVKLVNRNPRNLEQMLLAPKPMGHELDSPNRHYWNKIIFEKKSKFLVGKIVHHTGRTILTVSTNEVPIAAQLPSGTGLKAAQLLGQILALRALESGIHSVFCDYDLSKETSVKLAAFIKSAEEGGITLEEQPFIFARSQRDL